ncbi:MAG: GNAT family N-acetyltransferase [Clostridiales bacterium]|jgi:ribosomal protein S18 acetylase RimI-like enzyme|nr:GNAT family N-acetyltransferase [Clostridiales bacterium]
MDTLAFIAYNHAKKLHRSTLLNMLTVYFDEITWNNPKDKVPKHFLPKLIGVIAEEISKYKEWLYLCEKDSEFIGFCLFQIDTADNVMCKREGWGFIREFYVAVPYRRRGYARQMCIFAENKILQYKPTGIYLTADKNGILFWEAMGYTKSGKADEKNGNEIYEKYCAE